MKRKIHVVPHSHWDREWYMPLESMVLYHIQIKGIFNERFTGCDRYTGK